MSSSSLIVEHHQAICSITLNRPQQQNAFDEQLISNLQQTLDQLNKDQSVRVIILKATGNNFCAGADLNWMKSMANYTAAENFADSMKLASMLNQLATINKPTIALVQGCSYGGGVGLIACCDIAIAAPNATFCLSEVKLGLIPAVISPYVIAAIGARPAKRYFMTAEMFDAKQALQLNLIHEICPDNLEQRAYALAQIICHNGPQAVTAAKQLVAEIMNKSIDDKLIAHTANCIAKIRVSAEGQEGITAFLEKRLAEWNKK